MNSLQIDYLNAVNNARKIDAEIELNKSRTAEATGRTGLINAQTAGQRMENQEFAANLSNLSRRVLNDKYRLDMDNAMLFNTVDWWVNGGKKLSDHYNRVYNTYWNTQGNLPTEVRNAVGAIGGLVSPAAQVMTPFVKKPNVTHRNQYNFVNRGFIS